VNYFNFNIEYNKWNYKVKREYCGKESIVDILIHGKDFIFYIENKTNSLEGWEQTPREYRDLERLAKSMRVRKKFPVFLTPTGVKPSDEKNWITMSYPKLACALEPSLIMIQSAYVRFFVESWLNILKYLGGSNEI